MAGRTLSHYEIPMVQRAASSPQLGRGSPWKAKWLVEQKRAVLIGADTSGTEVGEDPALAGATIPVHEYLLLEQGVHIGEFHYLEDLSRSKVCRFTYVAMTNRLQGTVAGTAMRPMAIE